MLRLRNLKSPFQSRSIGTRGSIAIAIILLASSYLSAQIKIYERNTTIIQSKDTVTSDSINALNKSTNPFSDKGLFFESPTRRKLMLNGEWNVSFNNGGSFAKLIVPCSYDFSGTAFFNKNFSISSDTLANYSFLLVAEGINNTCEIKINDIFITKHTGGGLPVITPIDEGIIREMNTISISVDSRLTNSSLPLANVVSFGRVSGGIDKDIYIMVVPKIYSLANYITYSVGADNSAKVKITSSVKSTVLDKMKSEGFKSFYVINKIVKRTTGEEVVSSSKNAFTIENNNIVSVVSEAVIKNPELWSPDTPNLYVCKTEIYQDDVLIDENDTEFGIYTIQKKAEQFTINGKNIKLYGTNYFEASVKFGSALDYNETLAELTNIKKQGFNSIRVAGAAAHPYLLNICSRIGLFLFEDAAFNEVPEFLLKKPAYTDAGINLLMQTAMRDRNYPCVLAYGLGNEFDVSSPLAADYIKKAKSAIDTISKKFTYYTTSNYKSDKCFGLTDLKGLNFYENGIEKVVKYNEYFRSTMKQAPELKNTSLFVASFGITVNNDNRNGYSDAHSQEAQTKYFVDAFKILDPISSGLFVAAWADYPTGRPELFPQHPDGYLRTNGLHTIERNAKQSAEFLRRLIVSEDTPKILEGSTKKSTPQIFLVVGLGFIVVLIILLNQYKRFREYFFKCIFQPETFFMQLREQMIVPMAINMLLTLMISVGLAIYFANILYYYKEYANFDIIVTNFLPGNDAKQMFIDLINEPWKFILAFTVVNVFLNLLTAIVLYIISLYIRGRVYFKNVYIVAVWSSLPLIIMLPIGTVLYKLNEFNISLFFYSLIVFLIAYIFYIVRLVKGTQILFEVRSFRSYIYGYGIFLIVFVLIYFYYSFFTNAIDAFNMVFANLN
jgi:beta-galactosidase